MIPIILVTIFLFCLYTGLYKTAIFFGVLITALTKYLMPDIIDRIKYYRWLSKMTSQERKEYNARMKKIIDGLESSKPKPIKQEPYEFKSSPIYYDNNY